MATADLELLLDKHTRFDSLTVCFQGPSWQRLSAEKAQEDAQIAHVHGSQAQLLAHTL